jgi:hypothetical protein
VLADVNATGLGQQQAKWDRAKQQTDERAEPELHQ